MSRALLAVRPECVFSSELVIILDRMVKISDAGEILLYQPLAEAGAPRPVTTDPTACTLVTGFLTRLPDAAAPRELAEAIAVNLRSLARHIELKARLAADDALLAGQERLARALALWSTKWRVCGQMLHIAVRRARARFPHQREFVSQVA
jgi:hypothetical protein